MKDVMFGWPPLLLALVAALLGGAAHGQANPALVQEVAEGKRTEARASWWGFDPADSTEFLQAAINSGARKLIVDNLGRPWVVRPLNLASNQEIVFEAGTIVEAKPGEFLGRNDSLFKAMMTENVILRGEGDGVILRMRKADYHQEPYEKAEWRHTLDLRSVDGFEVSNLTLASSGGDGIYFGVGQRGVACRNVVVRDVVCDDHNRQGVSVISADNVLMENVVMSNTGGTAPQAGIDFEPNNSSERVSNFVMRNCVAENNKGPAYVFYLPNLNAESEPVSVTMENCIARGEHPSTFRIVTGNTEAEAVGGFIKAVDCTFEGGTHGAVAIVGPPTEGGLKTILENCTISHPVPDMPAMPPILLQARAGSRQAVGGLTLAGVTLIDPVERRPIGYQSWTPGVGVGDIAGTLRLVDDGETTTLALTPELLEEWMPISAARRIDPYPMDGVRFEPAGLAGDLVAPPGRIRKAGTALVYADAGDQVALTIQSFGVGRYADRPVGLTVKGPDGAEVAKGETPFSDTGEFRFTAPATGLYRVEFDLGPHAARVTAASHPLVLSGLDAPVPLIGSTGEFFFLVPAGVKTFAVVAMGENQGEGVKAAVIDPQGNEVWAEDNVTEPRLYIHERADTGAAEVWSVRVGKPSGTGFEDFRIDLLGVPQIFAGSPAGLLQPVKD